MAFFFLISGRWHWDSSFRARGMRRTLNDESSWGRTPCRFRAPLIMSLVLMLSVPCAHGQQLTPDQQADMLLSSARRAYNEKNYTFASTRFREFLGKFGNHKEANAARSGLSLALMESQLPDF